MYEYKITNIEKVVDGDTIYCTVSLGFFVKYLVKVRMQNIDTPEINVKDVEEKRRGMLCKAYAVELLDVPVGNLVLRTTGRTGKYGRWIGNILITDKDGKVHSFVELMREFLKTI